MPVDVESIAVKPSDSPLAPTVAVDGVDTGVGGTRHFQEIKSYWGVHGTVNETQDVDGKRLPIGGAQVGLTNEAAPGTDTGASGLNGRLQRIAQRLTSLIALLPTALTALGALKTGPAEGTVTVSIAIGQTTSPVVDMAGMRNLGLFIPATFDGTTISFTACDTSGGTFVPVNNIWGQLVTMTVAASQFYDLPGELTALRFIKIVCGTAQATTTTDFILAYRS